MLGLKPEDISTILVGVSLFIAWVLGGQKGKQMVQKSPVAQPGNVVEVAGAIVSDRAVDKWIEAMTHLAACIDKNTIACNNAANNAKEASEAMQELAKEVEFNTRIRQR